MKHLKIFILSVLALWLAIFTCSFAQDGSLPENKSGKTVIRKISIDRTNDVSALIISKNGTVIACDPMIMPDNIAPDLVIVTHDHHIDPQYLEQCKDAKTSIQKPESFVLKDFKVTGIAASHTGAPVNPDNPSLVIYALDVDGLRIAYFACIGQEELTPEQMTRLGKIDIAMITVDDYPGWISVEKACAVINQLKPQMTIPLSHHYADYDRALQQMEKVAGPLKTVSGKWEISPADLKDGQRQVINIGH